MAQKIREAAERTDDESTDASIAQRARSAATTGNRLGTAAMLAGGALVVRAARSERRTLTSLQTFAGAALVGLGLRQRLSGRSQEEHTTSGAGRTHEDDENPRGTDDEPDVETKTDPHEGRIQFTDDADEETHSHPDLDDESGDPRVHEDEDEVTVDLSEASLADEASEATGPTTEQAMPAQTDATEPDRSPDEDVSNVQSDEAAVEEFEEETDAGGESGDVQQDVDQDIGVDEEDADGRGADEDTNERGADESAGPDLDIDVDEALGVGDEEDTGTDTDSDDTRQDDDVATDFDSEEDVDGTEGADLDADSDDSEIDTDTGDDDVATDFGSEEDVDGTEGADLDADHDVIESTVGDTGEDEDVATDFDSDTDADDLDEEGEDAGSFGDYSSDDPDDLDDLDENDDEEV